MSITHAAEKSIVVRAVQRRRYTDTDGRTVRRTVRFSGPILSSDLQTMKEGEEVTLWIEETSQTQEALGSITSDEEHREQLAPEIQLTLPHAAFTAFWNAASSTDSAVRNVTLKIEDAMTELAITDVVLLEVTPIHPRCSAGTMSAASDAQIVAMPGLQAGPLDESSDTSLSQSS
jgi:hypothetical protein